MDAKQYLQNVRGIWDEIHQCEEKITNLELSLLPAGIRYDKDKVQTSPTDPLSGRMAEIADLQRDIDDKISGLLSRQRQAQRFVDVLEDSLERQVLSLYYLGAPPMRMAEVARVVHYSRDYTYKVFERALGHLNEYYKDS